MSLIKSLKARLHQLKKKSFHIDNAELLAVDKNRSRNLRFRPMEHTEANLEGIPRLCLIVNYTLHDLIKKVVSCYS